jgi:hypothetical protein
MLCVCARQHTTSMCSRGAAGNERATTLFIYAKIYALTAICLLCNFKPSQL